MKLAHILAPVAALPIALGIGVSAAGASVNITNYQFNNRTLFASDPNQTIMTWTQATITLPSAPPTWTAEGQEASGWLMGGVDDLANWNQVGWVSYGPGSAPQLYEETSVNGNDAPQYFGTLQWGQTINVALSCDMGTGIWQDFVQNASGGWSELATEWTMVPCNRAVWFAAVEKFDNGAPTWPTVGAESITNLFSDVSGDEFFPSSLVVAGL